MADLACGPRAGVTRLSTTLRARRPWLYSPPLPSQHPAGLARLYAKNLLRVYDGISYHTRLDVWPDAH